MHGCVRGSGWVGSLDQGALWQDKEFCLLITEVSHALFCHQAVAPKEAVQPWARVDLRLSAPDFPLYHPQYISCNI